MQIVGIYKFQYSWLVNVNQIKVSLQQLVTRAVKCSVKKERMKKKNSPYIC